MSLMVCADVVLSCVSVMLACLLYSCCACCLVLVSVLLCLSVSFGLLAVVLVSGNVFLFSNVLCACLLFLCVI